MRQLFQENRNGLLLLLTLLFVLVIAIYFFLYQPLSTELKQTENEEQALKQEISVLEERLDNLSIGGEETESTLERLRLEPLIPSTPNLDELLLTLHEIELVSDSRIDDLSFGYNGDLPERDVFVEDEEQTEETEDETGETAEESDEREEVLEESTIEFNELPNGLEPIIVTLNVQSPDYDQFQILLKEIEKQERVMFVSHLHFDKPAERELKIEKVEGESISATIDITTFYFSH